MLGGESINYKLSEGSDTKSGGEASVEGVIVVITKELYAEYIVL